MFCSSILISVVILFLTSCEQRPKHAPPYSLETLNRSLNEAVTEDELYKLFGSPNSTKMQPNGDMLLEYEDVMSITSILSKSTLKSQDDLLIGFRVVVRDGKVLRWMGNYLNNQNY